MRSSTTDAVTDLDTDAGSVTAADEAAAAPREGHKLAIRDLVKVFPGGRRSSEVVALGGVDVHVDTGEMVSLVGTSGCGKSTLLRIVAGLETPTSGDVLVDGEPVIGPGPDRGMVFQGYSLFPWLDVAENIAFGLRLAGTGKADRRERVDELLGIMGLSEHARRLPKELSGGMRQRVAIARALAPEPDVLLLDEPFGSLDAQTRLSMHEFLRSVWRRTGATILLVTHDVDEAVYLSGRVYVLHAHPGRIVEEITMTCDVEMGPAVKRSPQFLDVRDEIHDLLMQA
jgi:NitT/TauT family transport system ATP-binding protein